MISPSHVRPKAGSVAEIGQEMHDLIAVLYPICRSITGEGVRQTLGVLRQHIPLETHEVATGTAVYDWTIPREQSSRAELQHSHPCHVVAVGIESASVFHSRAPEMDSL